MAISSEPSVMTKPAPIWAALPGQTKIKTEACAQMKESPTGSRQHTRNSDGNNTDANYTGAQQVSLRSPS